MHHLDLLTISQGPLAIMNPTTPEKVLAMGTLAGLSPGTRVVECGCGNGTVLALWANAFGIAGTGIEIREEACRQAETRLAEVNAAGQVDIRCMDASLFAPQDAPYDVAVALGASDIWGGTGPALDALGSMVHGTGAIILGDRYWRVERVPPEFAREWGEIPTEYELLCMVRERGLELAAVVRSATEDWDAYESGIWRSCLAWLEGYPGHPSRGEVLDYFHRVQEEYLAFGREHLGWAMYLIRPRRDASHA
ncbi:MAG: class I SAM-dependent methyltransferase [Methanomicrobiaceae archaeon]|nr:class I SAM-dependent methyltransferase [Methanomicrobiaceae archaeon]